LILKIPHRAPGSIVMLFWPVKWGAQSRIGVTAVTSQPLAAC
jgi:hypothetical protein